MSLVNLNYLHTSTVLLDENLVGEIYDVGVIGGGPGGYVAAIRAAQLGGKVVLVEKDRFGGTCINWGCIPTKALLRSIELLSETKRAQEFGLVVKESSIDLKRLMERKEAIVKRLVDGINYLLDANGVKVLKGIGAISSPKQITITQDCETISADAEVIIIATGSRAKILPIPGVDSRGVMTSDEALIIEAVPESLLIIGGGPEGAEFACIYSRLGCRVTIVEMLPNMLPFEDRELGNRLAQALKKEGVTIHTNTTVKKIIDGERAKKVTLLSGDKEMDIEVEKVMLAVGRQPNVEGIGLEKLGVNYGKKGIIVNDRMQTNIKDVYAIGDVAGGGLAHVASEQGIVAAENAMGEDVKIDLKAVPRCVYSIPEVAAVGLTETQAKEGGHDIAIGRFPFSANGRALTLGDAEGVVKIVSDKKTGEILGVHIVGPRATDLIPEAVLAVKLKAKTEDLAKTIHPHPTLSEVLKEAALDSQGAAINMKRR
jgi:dihydrolipoamide dehydrogenase